MGLCNDCYDPGSCCKGFALLAGGAERTFPLDGEGSVETYLRSNRLPFRPKKTGEFVDEESGERHGTYVFSCPELTPEGRCGIYRSRPKTCRDFEPAGGSLLCVHTGGAEGTGDGL